MLTTLLLIVSCSDDILNEFGENPNRPVNVTSKLLISQTTLTTAFETSATDLAWFSSVFVEHTVGVHAQMRDIDRRIGINSSLANNGWNSLYARTLSDLADVVEICSEGGKEEGNNTSLGIAKILMAYNYSVATDLWGEVPFTEALQGNKNRAPKYDDQQTIYNGIFSLLKEGIALLKMDSDGNPGDYDFFYKGHKDSWIAAANSLLMRYYNRLSNINLAYSDSILLVLPDAINIDTANMVFKSYQNAATAENPWWEGEAYWNHLSVSKTLDDILVDLNDPRRKIFFDPIKGVINPAPPGDAERDQPGLIYSKFISNYLSSTSPQPIITYDEVKFIEAEAQLRKGNITEAYVAYIEGIRQAMIREGVSTADIEVYLLQAKVADGATALTQYHIITQKYIALWLFQPIEAYNDYRRTRMPILQNKFGVPPERLPYTTDEIANNVNVPSKLITDKVWWAK